MIYERGLFNAAKGGLYQNEEFNAFNKLSY